VKNKSIISFVTSIRENNDSLWSFFAKHYNIIWNKMVPCRIRRNVYKTNFSHNAIVCYMIRPFLIKNMPETAPNIRWATIICEEIGKLGYNIDVVEWNCILPVNTKKYDLAFGFGRQFDRCLLSETIRYKIPFLTGASPYYSNVAEQNRNMSFAMRNCGARMFELRRQVAIDGGLMNLQALRHATIAFYIGNDWVKNTYKGMIGDFAKLPNVACGSLSLTDINRDLNSARKNYLWFGGIGMLHKGLDLCLEAFREAPRCNLYIAGPKDDDFFSFYQEDFKSHNIFYLGFVDINSEYFRDICENCLFSIMPSCSEAGCSSVLTTMRMGMIPVVTRECGIAINDYGVCIEGSDVRSVIDIIEYTQSLSINELDTMQNKASDYVLQNHTHNNFKKEFEYQLTALLS